MLTNTLALASLLACDINVCYPLHTCTKILAGIIISNFYVDLWRLLKDNGLKVNLKADKLLKALKNYYKQQDSNIPVREKEVNEKILDDYNSDSTQNAKCSAKCNVSYH